MRWRLGRPAAKKKTTPRPVDLVVASAGQASTTAAAAAASTSRERLGGSPEIGSPATGDDVDSGEFYCATTATCLRLRGHAANGEPANVGSQSLMSASFVSYVERLGSQSRPEPSPAETCDISRGSRASTRHDDDARMKAGSRGEGSKKSYLSVLGGRNHGGRSQTAALSPSSSPRMDRTVATQEEDLLISEIHDFQLRRGADWKVAAGAARVCMSLISSREPTPEAMKDLGPRELVSLARANLGFSSAATACLLGHLVRQDLTAARLATAGTDFDFSHLCSPTADDADCIRNNGVVEGDANTTRQCRVGARANGLFLPGTDNVVVSGAEKEEAVTGAKSLSLACRTWRDIISAISDMARRGGLGFCTGANPVGAIQGKSMCGSAKDSQLSPRDPSWCCSLGSWKDQCRPTGKENNECSTTAKAATAERVDGSQHFR